MRRPATARTKCARRVAVFLAALFLAAPTPANAAESADPPPAFDLGNQFVIVKPLRPAPAVAIRGPTGAPVDLARYRGKVLLVNFWATWCPACVEELPALSRLQAALGGDAFAVVLVSVDRDGARAALPYLRHLGITNLRTHYDPDRALGKALGLYGFPMSYVIDRDGRVAGYVAGPAHWDAPGGRALIRFFIAGNTPS
jgi:thiol-disulfide isomerase/thioredoxin